jgi:serpin B
MNMKRIHSVILAGSLCVSLAACAPPADGPGAGLPPGSTAVRTLALTAQDFVKPDWETYNQAPTDGANDFALRLTAALLADAADADNANFVCSPYSVWLPLAALVNATDKAHQAELLTALGAAGISPGDLNLAVSQMFYRLTSQQAQEYAENAEDYHNPLQIANAIFVDDEVTLRREFAQTFLDYYRGTVFNVDFSAADAVKAVNQWASANTDGLITDIVQEFDPTTVAALANAIYFSDRWNWEFNARETKTDVFHAPSGDTTAEFMLRQGEAQSYYEDEEIQAMPLSFQTGGSLYIIKPRDGDAVGFLQAFTPDYFDKIKQNTSSRTGKLLLPKFAIDSGVIRLADTLEALGVPLFDIDKPALDGVIREYPLYITDAVQKAVITVDEKGTTAAAVTVLAMAGSGMPMPTAPFAMTCDSPFVFVLCGNGDEILFTGVVNQP